MCINFIVIDKGRLFDLKLHIGFTIVYIMLSPFTVFYSIGKAVETWYQDIKNLDLIIQTFIMELEHTQYNSLSYKDLKAITIYLSQHLEFSEYDSFYEIFTELERRNVIYADDNENYHFNYQIGQDEGTML
jgi:hypothetical protein